jgi:hypothetical protein
MRPTILLSLATVVTLAACADPSASLTAPRGRLSLAAYATTSQIRLPLSGSVYDPCAGQRVSFTGEGNYVFHETYDDHGVTIDGHVNASNIKGVGTDGTLYVGSEAGSNPFHLNFSAGGGEFTSEVMTLLTSRGSAQNVVLHGISHLTVTPDGQITAAVSQYTAGCVAGGAP